MNISEMNDEQLGREIERGARFVVFTFVISALVITVRRNSDIYYIAPGESALVKGWKYSVITLLFGWWGIPWGPIYSFGALFRNVCGGIDVTQDTGGNYYARKEKPLDDESQAVKGEEMM